MPPRRSSILDGDNGRRFSHTLGRGPGMGAYTATASFRAPSAGQMMAMHHSRRSSGVEQFARSGVNPMAPTGWRGGPELALDDDDDDDDELDLSVVQSEGEWKSAKRAPKRPSPLDPKARAKAVAERKAAKAVQREVDATNLRNRKKREKKREKELAVRESLRQRVVVSSKY